MLERLDGVARTHVLAERVPTRLEGPAAGESGEHLEGDRRPDHTALREGVADLLGAPTLPHLERHLRAGRTGRIDLVPEPAGRDQEWRREQQEHAHDEQPASAHLPAGASAATTTSAAGSLGRRHVLLHIRRCAGEHAHACTSRYDWSITAAATLSTTFLRP